MWEILIFNVLLCVCNSLFKKVVAEEKEEEEEEAVTRKLLSLSESAKP